jgi:hypothetical protein
VATILRYIIEYASSEDDLREAFVDITYNKVVAKAPDDILDETARRYLIAAILKEGGRVLKIRRVSDEDEYK